MAKQTTTTDANLAANLGFEDKLRAAADKLRGNAAGRVSEGDGKEVVEALIETFPAVDVSDKFRWT